MKEKLLSNIILSYFYSLIIFIQFNIQLQLVNNIFFLRKDFVLMGAASPSVNPLIQAGQNLPFDFKHGMIIPEQLGKFRKHNHLSIIARKL